jgi:beta-lactamase class A
VKKRTVVIGAAVLIGLNVLAWALLCRPATTSSTRANYPYLSSRIFSDSPNDILINFVSLRKELRADFDALPDGTKYSFFFEYLPSGMPIKIGSDNELIAASLIKVPLVMNLYRAAELGKISLDKTVTIRESELDSGYGNLWKKGAGTQYTLRRLAQFALENSDNTATHAIFDNVNGLLADDQQSLSQLDIDLNTENSQAVIDAFSYTSVLKSLYLSSYLSRDDSQEVLGYLTQSDEHERLTKELPSNVKVAHKNGVYDQDWSESDCGIVYVPKRPYAVCIMVGLPDEQANSFIATTSKKIYDYVVDR